MPDYRVVQCFGIKRKPHKPDKYCRRRYGWTSSAMSGHFGSKGVQACPHCGTIPDFKHPFNRYLVGDLSEEEAQAMMPDYIKTLEEEKKT